MEAILFKDWCPWVFISLCLKSWSGRGVREVAQEDGVGGGDDDNGTPFPTKASSLHGLGRSPDGHNL